MSNEELPDDSTHPANMDPEAHKALMAELENEDANAADPHGDDTTGAPAGEGEGTEVAGDPEGAGKDEGAGEGAGKEGDPVAGTGDKQGKDPAAADAGEGEPAGSAAPGEDDEKVDKKALNGVLAELRATREEVKALKAQQQARAELPTSRDFKAERDALKEKWDTGELDTDEYHEQRDALVLEEAEHRAAVRFHQLQQQAADDSATQAWQVKVTAWEEQNKDFLANPIRRKAVNDLMTALEADPANKLSDEELLEKVQEQAFEAFNWQHPVAPATPAVPAVNPRQVAAARAAAAASSAPPAVTGGVGNAALAGKLDLEGLAVNPSKATGAKQAINEVLGDEA